MYLLIKYSKTTKAEEGHIENNNEVKEKCVEESEKIEKGLDDKNKMESPIIVKLGDKDFASFINKLSE